MSTITDYYKKSELALAAYADFAGGVTNYQSALVNAGMSDKQATEFALQWSVLAQFPDATSQTITGVSATLFKNTQTGEITLAIRGTEPSLLDIGADGLLALSVPSKLNPQYIALKSQIDTWLAPGGPLNGQSFGVAGHSLGGYLAAAVKEQYPAQTTQAYLYNAPGYAGVFGELMNGIGVVGAGNGAGISNIVGSEGLSVIAGLGIPAASPMPVLIEPASGLGFGNHRMFRLVDSLAVYALYDKLAPGLDIAALGKLIDDKRGIFERVASNDNCWRISA